MGKSAAIQPRMLGALALWAGADHYSLWQAITRQSFCIPAERVSRVYRIEFPKVAGVGPRDRYLVGYRSEKRDCLVVLDQLPAGLEHWAPMGLTPMMALRLFLRLIWSEPSAVVSLFLIPLPIFLLMILFVAWVNLVSHNPEVLSIFRTETCDSGCVEKVVKVHSMVGVLFMMPFALVVLPLGLMIFQAPRYKSAIHYRFAQSYCAVSLAIGVYLLAQLMVFFPFKNYSKFVMGGFGPQAEYFIKNRIGPAKK